MNELVGDIWELHDSGCVIAIPVNQGWKRNGLAVMGLGVAREAALRFPHLPAIWGEYCRKSHKMTPVTLIDGLNLVMFPTKGLNEREPHMSWEGMSDFNLIVRSCQELKRLISVPTYLPVPGCGAGRLDPAIVLPAVRKELEGSIHTLVHRKSASPRKFA